MPSGPIRQTIVLKDFSGGEVGYAPDLIGENQAEILENFFVEDGTLRSSPGRKLLTPAPIVEGYPVRSLCVWFKNGIKYTLAVCGSKLWLDTTGAFDFRPIYDLSQDEWDCRLSFAEFGGRLVMAVDTAESTTPAFRWDGVSYTTGLVAISLVSGAWRATGSGGAFFNDTVGGQPVARGGDTIYYQHPTTGIWVGAYIDTVTSGYVTLRYDAVISTVATPMKYIIVRVHRQLLTPPTSVQKIAGTPGAAASGSMAAGRYRYYWAKKCSWTGAETNQSPVSLDITAAANGSVLLSGWDTYSPLGEDAQNDRVVIRRTPVNGEGWPECYQIKELQRDQAGYTFPATYLDTANDSAWTDEASPTEDHFGLARGIRKIQPGNKRLYAIDINNLVYGSQLGNCFYWQTLDPDQDSPLDQDIPAISGFLLTIGQPGEQVLTLTREGGTWGTSGRPGSNMLAWTSASAERVSGKFYQEIRIDQALMEGLVSSDGVTEYLDFTFYMSKNGPSMLQAGARSPVNLWEIPYPHSSKKFVKECNPSQLDLSIVGIWGPYVFFLWPGVSSFFNNFPGPSGWINNRALFFHMGKQQFVRAGRDTQWLEVSSVAVVNGPGGMDEFYYGDQYGNIWQLFESQDGTHSYWWGPTGASDAAMVNKDVSYVVNGDFETGDTTGWSALAASGSIAISFSKHHAGNGSLAVSSTAAQIGIAVSANISVGTKKRVAMSAWVNTYANTGASGMNVEFFSVAGVSLGTGTEKSIPKNAADTFVYFLLGWADIPAGTSYMRLKLTNSRVGAAVVNYWDDVHVHFDEPVLARYRSGYLDFDGDPYRPSKLEEMEICFSTPVAAQNATVRIYNTDQAAACWEKAIVIAHSTSPRTFITLMPNTRGRQLQVEIDGQFTEPMSVFWIRMELVGAGKDHDQKMK